MAPQREVLPLKMLKTRAAFTDRHQSALALLGSLTSPPFLWQDDDVVLWQKRRYGRETPVPMEEGSLLDADMLMSEFTDTLFSTLSSHQLVSWPNSRDIGICWL